MGDLCGYARVSTIDQDPELQERELRAAGCCESGLITPRASKVMRPQWEALAGQLRRGDTVVVGKLDRFARSLSHLIATIADLDGRGVGLNR